MTIVLIGYFNQVNGINILYQIEVTTLNQYHKFYPIQTMQKMSQDVMSFIKPVYFV